MTSTTNKTVRNERIKLRATALNSLAIASVVAGFITPLAALSFGLTSQPGGNVVASIAAAAAWLGIGLILHLSASWLLGGLEE